MLWDTTHRRAAGFAIEILRPGWLFTILTVMAEHVHLHPVEIAGLLRQINTHNTPIIGPSITDPDRIARRITSMYDEGLLTRCHLHAARGAHTAYDLTRLGAGLLGSLSALGLWSPPHYEPLVRAERLRRGLDPDTPIPAYPNPARLSWFTTRMAIGTLDTRWGFSLLAHCSHGPIQPGALHARVNDALSSQADLAGRRQLGQKSLHETLGWLGRAGLLKRSIELRPGRAPLVLYQPTMMGFGLLEGLWPVAQWGVQHDKQLYRIVATRAGWVGN